MPIYRYRCNECDRELEFIQRLSDEKQETKTFDHEQEFGGHVRQCPGTFKRMYDTFQFHISGR